jgi:hypothetical protein
MGSARLTDKQIKWCHAYHLNGHNGVQAARDAGYAGDSNTLNSASQTNRKNVRVMAFLEKLETDSLSEGIAAPEDLLRWWTVVMNGEIPGMKTGDMTKASECLGRYHAMFTDKKEITEHTVQRVMLVPDWSPEDWEKYYLKDVLKEEE